MKGSRDAAAQRYFGSGLHMALMATLIGYDPAPTPPPPQHPSREASLSQAEPIRLRSFHARGSNGSDDLNNHNLKLSPQAKFRTGPFGFRGFATPA